MEVWLLEYTRWPGYDEYSEVVGVYSSAELAKQAVPYEVIWKIVSEGYRTEVAQDKNSDEWFIYPETVDAPIVATYATWEEEK